MLLKGIIEEDFSSYKVPSMLLAFPKCTFKCGEFCQNIPLAKSENIEYDIPSLINRYMKNKITSSIIFAGLEPFDSFLDVFDFIRQFRAVCDDEIVVYTGFDEHETTDKTRILSQFKNIIIKFGRFIPDQEKHYDGILGVELASPNQYAKIIS